MAQGQITTERCKATRERGSLSGAAGPDGGQWATGSAQKNIQHRFKSRGRQTSTSRRRRSWGRCCVQLSEGKLSFETGSTSLSSKAVSNSSGTKHSHGKHTQGILPPNNFYSSCTKPVQLSIHLFPGEPSPSRPLRATNATAAQKTHRRLSPPAPARRRGLCPRQQLPGAQPPRSPGAPHGRSAPTSGHSLPAGKYARRQASMRQVSRQGAPARSQSPLRAARRTQRGGGRYLCRVGAGQIFRPDTGRTRHPAARLPFP